MRDEKLSTRDFVAAGQRTDEPQAGRETEMRDQEIGPVTTAGVGGARMVKEPASTPLFSNSETENFRSRWDQIQIGFVDEPRRAVEDADNLVAETMKRLAEIFTDERQKMEDQWSKGGDVSTEDLRLALQRYRSFFNRLLTL
jgi:hypothetical protein